MAIYGVLIKEAPASVSLVREGFTMPALLFGPVWFAWRRAWLGAILWCGGVALTVTGGAMLGVGPGYYLGAVFIFMCLMALEASRFRQRSLMRRGYQLADIVEARDQNEAEIRFLARQAPALARPREFHVRPGPRNGEAIGLFLNGT
ncbi:MAG: DUF2628 domain-containing protein [Beijerinckiaceae bacterium]|nr:DUF2628 domain-containing protein [Beijerinckiaceae bacterium]